MLTIKSRRKPEVAIYVRPDLGGQRLKVGACYRHPPDLEATGSQLAPSASPRPCDW